MTNTIKEGTSRSYRLSVNVTPALANALRAVANAERKSMTDIIIYSVWCYLEAHSRGEHLK